MKQYLVSVHHDWDESRMAAVPADEMEARIAAVGAFNTELAEAGMLVFAGGLFPPSSATVLRPQPNGDVIMTDGPFAETKEQIGGFWIINAPDLDVALAWAKRGAAACQEITEVRPFQEEPSE